VWVASGAPCWDKPPVVCSCSRHCQLTVRSRSCRKRPSVGAQAISPPTRAWARSKADGAPRPIDPTAIMPIAGAHRGRHPGKLSVLKASSRWLNAYPWNVTASTECLSGHEELCGPWSPFWAIWFVFSPGRGGPGEGSGAGGPRTLGCAPPNPRVPLDPLLTRQADSARIERIRWDHSEWIISKRQR